MAQQLLNNSKGEECKECAKRQMNMADAKIARFEDFKDFRAELNQVKLKLDEKETVERAKNLLMNQRGIDEDSAYEMLTAMAVKKNMKLVDLSKQFVDVANMLIV